MDSYDDKGVGGGVGGKVGGGGEAVGDPDARTVPEPRIGPEPRAEREPRTDSEPRPDPGLRADADHHLTGAEPRVGMAGLSFPYQVVAAVALSVIGLIAGIQLAMVFLHVAPSNTLTKQHGEAVDQWIYPEFEQNWKLFAPNPLQQNIAVHVRAEISGPEKRRTTPG